MFERGWALSTVRYCVLHSLTSQLKNILSLTHTHTLYVIQRQFLFTTITSQHVQSVINASTCSNNIHISRRARTIVPFALRISATHQSTLFINILSINRSYYNCLEQIAYIYERVACIIINNWRTPSIIDGN